MRHAAFRMPVSIAGCCTLCICSNSSVNRLIHPVIRSRLSTWLASLSSTSSYSEILQSTTTLLAGDKDQLPIQSIQSHGTSCLELSVSSYQMFWYCHYCSVLHTTPSNTSSATGASNLNSWPTVPHINVFDVYIHCRAVSASGSLATPGAILI